MVNKTKHALVCFRFNPTIMQRRHRPYDCILCDCEKLNLISKKHYQYCCSTLNKGSVKFDWNKCSGTVNNCYYVLKPK